MTDPARDPDREAAEAATAESATERMTFFSDAVIAIAITLLAIELPVPTIGTFAELVEALHEHAVEYAAFLISFAVIGGHWIDHHRLFRYVHRSDGRMLRLNLTWLLVVVLTPFLTKVAQSGDGTLAFAFYAIPQVLQALLTARMSWEVSRHGWFAPSAPWLLVHRGWVRPLYFAIGFAISIPAHLVINGWAFALWWLVPVVLTAATRRRFLEKPAETA